MASNQVWNAIPGSMMMQAGNPSTFFNAIEDQTDVAVNAIAKVLDQPAPNGLSLFDCWNAVNETIKVQRAMMRYRKAMDNMRQRCDR